ncbi:hypothetical protein [Hyphomicrobium sp. DY-1]|uniref:hypothetical protein n=1 Tax=Hyphomicrobium sp. DY-1 TaxID=3075650 RepID=UPI0039C1579D
MRTEVSRNVTYTYDDDNVLTIALNPAWNGEMGFRTFPKHVRTVVEAAHALSCRPEELTKLRAADLISTDMLAAVRDDILCGRAERLMAAENTYTAMLHTGGGDANHPWLHMRNMAAMMPDLTADHPYADEQDDEEEMGR